MSQDTVVIVESPAKAKTINKYLGSDFMVLASFGHVRDLPPKDGSVRPDDDFAMDWALSERSKKHVDEIARAVKSARRVFLATDPDREGEAIAWHVTQVLADKRLLAKVDVQRITFNEITKSAVRAAIAQPRTVNRELVEAYLARRALDYLVGFTLSPVLWRKLPGSKSAGRVQSVALRLICEREAEIEAFRPQEFWTIETDFTTEDGGTFTARLNQLDGQKLDKFALGNKGAADAALERIAPLPFRIAAIERKQVRRHPAAPFITSTLQQEASRKLGFGATRTMRAAQALYEGVDIGGETVGLITYMRTDGMQLAQEAVAQARQVIGSSFGTGYLPDAPRVYKSTAKNAQEAHEAIRPTDLSRRPDDVAGYLDGDQRRLYELVWKRTVACQMASAILDQVAVDVACPDGSVVFRATGSVVVFDGFLRVYKEDRDDAHDDDKETRLPPVKEGGPVERGDLRPEQHFTQPPPRFTEASLVKRLEELGIGRPSTYASILQVLQDRAYVRLDRKRFHPEDRGRLVTAFLVAFFERYFDYGFTAALENQLDDVSGGRIDWKTVLREFWRAFSAAVEETQDLRVSEVIDTLDAELGPHFFRTDEQGNDPRRCPACTAGRLGLKLSRNGAFIGCSRYPECQYTRPLSVPSGEDGDGQALLDGPKMLGHDPESTLPVWLKRGPFGAYIQLGPPAEAAEPAKGKDRKPEKPKRVSVPKGLTASDVSLDVGMQLLALPREVGRHPESGEPITAGIGRFGAYLKHGTAYKSLPDDGDVLTIGVNRAVVLLAEPSARRGAATAPARVLGDHPADGKPIQLGSGRFGPYVKHGKIYASIPRSVEPEALTLAEAVALIDAKLAKAGEAKKTSKVSTNTGSGTKPAKAGPKTAMNASTQTATSPPSKAGSKAGAKPTAGRKPAGTATAATTAQSTRAAATSARRTAISETPEQTVAPPPTGTPTRRKRTSTGSGSDHGTTAPATETSAASASRKSTASGSPQTRPAGAQTRSKKRENR